MFRGSYSIHILKTTCQGCSEEVTVYISVLKYNLKNKVMGCSEEVTDLKNKVIGCSE